MSSKVAVVTGSNKGIGLAIVRALCKQIDGIVYLTARNNQNGREAVTKLEAEGLKPAFHQLDIDSADSIEALRKHIAEAHGGLDILINNAGIAFGTSTAPFSEQARDSVKTNFTGTLNVTRAFMPLVQPHGKIVNVSSMSGKLSRVSKELQERFTNPALTEEELVQLMQQFVQDATAGNHTEKGWPTSAYGVSKIGVTALAKVHAKEMAACGKEDILVNACCPGWVQTDMTGQRGHKTPDQGAETPVLLALLPPGSPSGEFWEDRKVSSW